MEILGSSNNNQYFYSHSVQVHNGDIKKDTETSLTLNDGKGLFEKKEFGKIIQDKKLTKREFDRFLEKEIPNAYIDEDVFIKASNILGLLIDTLTDPDNSEFKLEKGDEDKKTTKSSIKRKKVSRKEICKEFLDFVNVKEETAEKIRSAYEKYYKKFGDNCKLSKSSCKKELEKLEELYEKFNEPDNGCVRH